MKLGRLPIAAGFAVSLLFAAFISAFAADAQQAVDVRPVAAPAARAEVSAGSVKAEIGSTAGRGRLKKARYSKKAGGAVTAVFK